MSNNDYLKVIEDLLRENNHHYIWQARIVHQNYKNNDATDYPSVQDITWPTFFTQEKLQDYIVRLFAADGLKDYVEVKNGWVNVYVEDEMSMNIWLEKRGLKL